MSCDERDAIATLNQVLDMGYDHLDTAALYGFGANERLLSKAIGHRRSEFQLASKCGLFKNAQGQREINGHPDMIRQTCEDSLSRLGSSISICITSTEKTRRCPSKTALAPWRTCRPREKLVR